MKFCHNCLQHTEDEVYRVLLQTHDEDWCLNCIDKGLDIMEDRIRNRSELVDLLPEKK